MNYKAQRLPKFTNVKYVSQNKKHVQSQQKRAVKQQFYILCAYQLKSVCLWCVRKYLTIFVKLDIFSVVYILASGRRYNELNVKVYSINSVSLE